jgi:hypothetical protein
MAKSVMAIHYVPPVADKDGHASGSAHMIIPFEGYWFASGQRITWPSSQISQDLTHKIAGTDMPNVFQKDCCSCVSG